MIGFFFAWSANVWRSLTQQWFVWKCVDFSFVSGFYITWKLWPLSLHCLMFFNCTHGGWTEMAMVWRRCWSRAYYRRAYRVRVASAYTQICLVPVSKLFVCEQSALFHDDGGSWIVVIRGAMVMPARMLMMIHKTTAQHIPSPVCIYLVTFLCFQYKLLIEGNIYVWLTDHIENICWERWGLN